MKFWDYIKPYKYHAFLGFLFKVIEAILELMIPLIMADIIDVGILNGNKEYIIQRGGLLILLSTSGYLCALICQYFASYTSQSVGTSFRSSIFKKVNNLSLNQIDKITKSSLVTRTTGDVIQIQQAIAMTIRLTSRAPFLIVGSLILAFLLNKNLTYIFIIGAILLSVFMTIITIYALKQHTILQNLVDKLTMFVRETLEGNRVIRAFSKQTKQTNKFDDVLNKQKNKQIHVGMIQAISNPMTYLIVNVCILLIVYQGGLQVNIGNLSQGEVIALVNYMTQILLALIVYTNVMTLYNKAGVSYKRIKDLLEQPEDLVSGSKNLNYCNNQIISFDNVSFGYNEIDIIHNMSFTINQNESIGIIGGTGSGKSSIVKLMMRHYEVKQGSISIFGEEIKNIQLHELRKQFGYVPQIASLFEGSIVDNIKMNQCNLTNNEIKESLKKSQALEFVEGLENGLEFKVNQGGKNLSGGQRQRLTIARAIATKANILILDDSSSALDNVTERKLKESLESINCTKIIISQKVSTIENMDKIIVLDKGSIVATGNHKTLLESSDIYREIYQSQNKEGM